MNLSCKTIGDVTVIGFAEDVTLDSSNTDDFREQVAPRIEGRSKLVMDLSRVSFLDSSGIGTLLAIWRKAAKNDGDLKLAGIRPTVRTVFELSRLHRAFDIHATEAEAVASFHEN